MGELFARFLLVGAVAFGGGQAALPVLERLTIAETGWLDSQQFATGIGLAYATPGPVLILAAFVGQHVAGIPGALVATLAVFTVPVVVSAAAADMVARMQESKAFQAFGRYAGAAAIGLLGVTLLSLATSLVDIAAPWIVASAVVGVAALRGAHPLLLLGACAAGGALLGLQP